MHSHVVQLHFPDIYCSNVKLIYSSVHNHVRWLYYKRTTERGEVATIKRLETLREGNAFDIRHEKALRTMLEHLVELRRDGPLAEDTPDVLRASIDTIKDTLPMALHNAHRAA